MHSLVPLLGFCLLLFGHVGLLDGDNAERLRGPPGCIGIERHQDAVTRGDARKVEGLGLAQIGLSRRDAFELGCGWNLNRIYLAGVGLDGQRVAADGRDRAQVSNHLRLRRLRLRLRSRHGGCGQHRCCQDC